SVTCCSHSSQTNVSPRSKSLARCRFSSPLMPPPRSPASRCRSTEGGRRIEFGEPDAARMSCKGYAMLGETAMSHLSKAMVQKAVEEFRTMADGQVVLVLQGGGALGAYQVGVYHALHEAGVEPDWIIGTSIGAINAAIIAGNEPQNRRAKLDAFWKR